MLDKKIVTSELQNIFKLINACFDKESLLDLVAAKAGMEHLNRAMQMEAEKKGIKLPTDFKFGDTIFKKLSGRFGRSWGYAKIKDAADWIGNSFLYPKAENREERPITDQFLQAVEKGKYNKDEFKNFLSFSIQKKGIPDYFRIFLKTPMKKDKDKDEGEETQEKGPKKEKDITSPLHVLKNIPKEKEDRDYNFLLSPENQRLLEKHYQELHSINDLEENLHFKQLKQKILNWVDEKGTDAEKKILKLILKFPDMQIKEIAKKMHTDERIVSQLIHDKLRKHLIEYANYVYVKTNDDHLYNKLKEMRIPEILAQESKPRASSEEKLASIFNYIKALEKKLSAHSL